MVLLVTVPLGLWFDLDHAHDYRIFAHAYHVGPEYLVQLPGSLLDAVAFPDFSVVFSPTSLKYVIMFALVGTIESTLSVLAVDSMDPTTRASDLNRDLLALSVGNLASSLLGGLPMISEIVRSKANVDAGATSRWSNFFHGAFLLAFVALAPGLLSEIPLAALAAMLVYTGARLASPVEILHAKRVGRDQLALFVVTLVTTLATDLLVGVAVGIGLKLVLHVVRGRSLRALFSSKIVTHQNAGVLRVEIEGVAAFTTLLALRRKLVDISSDVNEVVVDFSSAALVDHTFLTRLDAMSQEWPTAKLSLEGLDQLAAASTHPHATRLRNLP